MGPWHVPGPFWASRGTPAEPVPRGTWGSLSPVGEESGQGDGAGNGRLYGTGGADTVCCPLTHSATCADALNQKNGVSARDPNPRFLGRPPAPRTQTVSHPPVSLRRRALLSQIVVVTWSLPAGTLVPVQATPGYPTHSRSPGAPPPPSHCPYPSLLGFATWSAITKEGIEGGKLSTAPAGSWWLMLTVPWV